MTSDSSPVASPVGPSTERPNSPVPTDSLSVHERNTPQFLFPTSADQINDDLQSQFMLSVENDWELDEESEEDVILIDHDYGDMLASDGESVFGEGSVATPTTPKDLQSPMFTQVTSFGALGPFPPYFWYDIGDVLEEEGLLVLMPWDDMHLNE